jgi:hypothetical protein
MAHRYDLDLTTVRDFTHFEWKGHVKARIMTVAENDMNVRLENRGYPCKAEPCMRMRPYVRNGGPNARYGLKFRWELVRGSDERFRRNNEVSLCKECRDHHGHHFSSFKQLMSDCESLVPARHRQAREEAIDTIMKDLPREEIRGPQGLRNQVKEAVETFSWPKCSKESLEKVLDLFARTIRYQERRAKVGG